MSLAKNHTKNTVNSTTSSEQNRFYKQHNQCSLCGHELSIEAERRSFEANAENKIQEKVSCPKCKIQISCRDHSLN